MPTINLGQKKKKNWNNNTKHRKERMKIYQSSQWAKLRMSKLMNDPLCEIHLEAGEVKEAIDVHHKDSFMRYEGLERTEKAYDYDNLLSVCKECHGKLHSGWEVVEIIDFLKDNKKNGNDN